MNTPRTKAPKRHGQRTKKFTRRPDGAYTDGLWSASHAVLIGQIATYWVLVEEQMIEILRDLLGGGKELPVRQIFRSIVSNDARRKLLQSLLERAPINREKDTFYDEVIAQFYSLNGRRNDYVHGFWTTYQDNETAYLSTESLNDYHFLEARKVCTKELETLIGEMDALFAKITDHRYPMVAEMRKKKAQAASSQGKPPPPPDEEKT